MLSKVKLAMRKIMPLRASTFSSYRKQEERELTELRSMLGRVERSLEDVRWQNEMLLNALNSLSENRSLLSCQISNMENTVSALINEGFVKAKNSERVLAMRVSTGLKTLEAKVNGLQRAAICSDERGLSDGLDWEKALTLDKDSVCDDSGIVVSLTSYPARIETVHKTIASLLTQSVEPDKIELWLAVEQFPLREAELPPSLLALVGERFSIRWCDDLRSHKKYYYAMVLHPNSLIITVDDDLIYQNDTVEVLMNAHRRFPQAICARRAREIRFYDDGTIAPYRHWPLVSVVGEPRMDLLATGVGGVLYPPHAMDGHLFDKELMMRACADSDDLWLKAMQLLRGTPTVLSDTGFDPLHIPGTQETSLFIMDEAANRNDADVKKIQQTLFGECPDVWGGAKVVAP